MEPASHEPSTTPIVGKKILFLYPPSVLQEELLGVIIKNEYEVYLVKDHEKMLSYVSNRSDIIVFINIDDRLNHNQWIDYTKTLVTDPAYKGVVVGILSYDKNPELAERYLMELGVQGGYIKLNLGLSQSTQIILRVLEANEARGRRKYVRAHCTDNDNASVNFQNSFGTSFNGSVLDISSVGFSCNFSASVPIKMRQLYRKMQLNLRGTRILVDGICVGIREGVMPVYVFLFDKKTLEENTMPKIHKFITSNLQRHFDKEFNR